MNDHPIALICYNRPHHLAQVLDALEALGVRRLYVFSDGPKDDREDAERVRAVRELLYAIRWTMPTVVMQPTNVGLATNVVGGVDYVLERHETVIVLEDDCVPGPHFYDYMADCLTRYRDVSEVASVSGYSYRLPRRAFEGYRGRYYSPDVFFFPRIETWGWATWRDRWLAHYIRNGDLAKRFAEARGGVDLIIGGQDVPNIIRNKLERGADSWSPGWLLGTALAGGLTVYPVRSHIQYIGDDGSGANMPATGRWRTDMATERAMHFPAEPALHQPLYEAMREIFDKL